jgi:hypothetical protein
MGKIECSYQGCDGTCVCTDNDGLGHTCGHYDNGTPVGDLILEGAKIMTTITTASGRNVHVQKASGVTGRIAIENYDNDDTVLYVNVNDINVLVHELMTLKANILGI